MKIPPNGNLGHPVINFKNYFYYSLSNSQIVSIRLVKV